MQPEAQSSARPATTSTDAPVESVLYSLMSIGRALRQRLQGDSVDPGTFWLLKGLAAHPALRVTELATFANLDASTVSRHVQQLHRTGLIERTPDPDDGRAQRVALSDRGREVLQQAMEQRRAILTRSLRDWDTSEIETFDRLLTRFVSEIESNTELEHA